MLLFSGLRAGGSTQGLLWGRALNLLSLITSQGVDSSTPHVTDGSRRFRHLPKATNWHETEPDDKVDLPPPGASLLAKGCVLQAKALKHIQQGPTLQLPSG